MEENRTNRDMDFLYNACFGISKVGLDYWITVPEFSDRIRYIESCGTHVDKQVVFEIMRGIYLNYEKMYEYTGKRPAFKFKTAKLGIESLWRTMTGSKEGWREA